MNPFARMLQQQSQHCGDAVALRDEQRALNYAELALVTAELADRLAGCASNLRVASVLDNSVDAAVLELAVRSGGGQHAALPPYFSPGQLQHALAALQPELLVLPADAKSFSAGWRAVEVPALPQCTVWKRTTEPTSKSAHVQGYPSACSVSFTSGTTGEPKGVVLEAQLLWNVAVALADSAAPLAVRKHLCVLPLATLLETVGGLYAGLISAATIELRSLRDLGYNGASGLDARVFRACIEDSAPHSLILVPQLLDALTSTLEQNAARLPSLRLLAVGGAAVGAALLQRAERVGLPVFEGYGLTECGSVVCLNRVGARRPGSVGKPLPHVRVRVDAAGEIHVGGAGPLGVIGGEPAASRPGIGYANDEYATGDLGHLDDEGFLYVHGRRRNVFITSYGRNVSPEWVEGLLCDEPCIAQAWVHGEARAWNAAVLVAPQASVDADTIERAVARCNARLPSYARIGGFILADRPFRPADGLATTNGRLRRDALLARYQPLLADLCPNPRLHPGEPAGNPSSTLKEHASA